MTVALTITGIVVWVVVGIFLLSRVWSAFRRLPKFHISNHWVVVTGCDSGIGLGVVKELVAQNASVIAFTYTEEGAHNALNEGAKLAPRLDITDEDAIQEAVKQVLELCGGELWGLVHNAGVVLPGFVEYQPLENYRRVMDVNMFAVANLTQQLIPALKATCGRVVIVSSVDGIVSLPGNAPYDASKFAVEAYADALRAELSFWGIEVSVINPSTMRTPLAMSFFEAHKQAWDQMDQRDPDGDWKEAYDRAWLDEYVAENTKRLDQIAQDPHYAINDIVDALTAKHPKMRYLSGTTAKTLFYALWKMPEEWSFVMKKGMIQPPPRVKVVAIYRLIQGSRRHICQLLMWNAMSMASANKSGANSTQWMMRFRTTHSLMMP